MRLDREIHRLLSEYPSRGHRRDSLDAVRRLRERLPRLASPAIAVVGTNGKTSTATYLARLLGGAGWRTGLYVSPHLDEWTERVRIDDEPCPPAELLAALEAAGAVAAQSPDPGELRFFDLLTVAAEAVMDRARVEVGVFEAGIGGRLDAVRLLEPRLVVLTGVAIDHAEILGESRAEILWEKLLVAPHGATVLIPPLGADLDRRADGIAAEHGLRLLRVERQPSGGAAAGLPAFLRAALGLAEAAAEAAPGALGLAAPATAPDGGPGIDLSLPGRFEQGERGGVPFVLDSAHNEAAWRELAAERRRRPGDGGPPIVALLSVGPDKRRAGLAAALRSLPGPVTVLVTRHTPLPAADPRRVAAELAGAGLDAEAVEPPAAAASAAFDRAGRLGGSVLAFGSTHLVGDLRRWLRDGPQLGSPS